MIFGRRKRAPEVCPHWPDGKHGDVRVYVWRRGRRRIVSVCIRCDGWWAEHELRADHNRRARALRGDGVIFGRRQQG